MSRGSPRDAVNPGLGCGIALGFGGAPTSGRAAPALYSTTSGALGAVALPGRTTVEWTVFRRTHGSDLEWEDLL